MTDTGLQRVLRSVAAIWQHVTIDDDVIATWRRALTNYTDARVMDAIDELASTRRWAPVPADVVDVCARLARNERDRRNLEQQRELTPFGEDPTNPHDREWNALDPDEQDEWIDRALGEWPPLPSIRRESSVIRARAAYLARTAQ